MELVRLHIPHQFIQDRVPMTWRDVLFGLEQKLLDPGAPVDFALEQLAREKEPAPEVVELAGTSKQEQSRSLVESLSRREQDEGAEGTRRKWLYLVLAWIPEGTRRKWLYLVLAWILEHRDELHDPLGAVEKVYADFGYPAEIASFVRYIPSNAPDLGSRERNEARLFARWLAYLEEGRAALAVRSDRFRPGSD
jgi:hypothetical protein